MKNNPVGKIYSYFNNSKKLYLVIGPVDNSSLYSDESPYNVYCITDGVEYIEKYDILRMAIKRSEADFKTYG